MPSLTPTHRHQPGTSHHAREGHLHPARKHVELIDVNGGGEGEQEAVKLGAFVDNSRRRAAKLSPERRAALDKLGMRW
ncbi:helicase associated domain-containing protein [Streptomyces sp. IB201691-2A2]|uniref:helicase associated domain-containing protein n=1 Tax=Streptomyces sp. IB201691-2A2 TaxID=2561920 RepID=UPI00163D46EA|nr:helicase associated domain-containing protein [Streptomyces sp. IB201691-2A2]